MRELWSISCSEIITGLTSLWKFFAQRTGPALTGSLVGSDLLFGPVLGRTS